MLFSATDPKLGSWKRMAASRQNLLTHASGQKCSEVFMCPHGVLKILEDVLNLIHFSKILHTIHVLIPFAKREYLLIWVLRCAEAAGSKQQGVSGVTSLQFPTKSYLPHFTHVS